MFLDDRAAQDERDAAWEQLCGIMRQPVLLQIRRLMEGWRRTEQLTDKFCEQLRTEFDGRGLAIPRFRLLVLEELHRFLTENHIEDPEIGEEFDKDWAARLLHTALRTLRRIDPTAHGLLMRAYDRPEGTDPWPARELARRLEVDPDEVQAALGAGVGELNRLFSEEIARTVADRDLLPAERNHLGRFTGSMFPDPGSAQSNGQAGT